MQPIVGVICGSGLGGLADLIDGDKKTLHYDKIPNFPRCNGTLSVHATSDGHVCAIARHVTEYASQLSSAASFVPRPF